MIEFAPRSGDGIGSSFENHGARSGYDSEFVREGVVTEDNGGFRGVGSETELIQADVWLGVGAGQEEN